MSSWTVGVEPACRGSHWRARLGNWLSLRDMNELDEVKNLREAEEAHAVSSRHSRIDTLKGAEGAGRAKAKRFWRKPTRGGRKPNGSAR